MILYGEADTDIEKSSAERSGDISEMPSTTKSSVDSEGSSKPPGSILGRSNIKVPENCGVEVWPVTPGRDVCGVFSGLEVTVITPGRDVCGVLSGLKVAVLIPGTDVCGVL